jgi:hypothetical protein
MASTTLDGTGTPFVIPQNNTRQVNDGDELLLLGTIQDDGTILVNGTGGPFQSLPTEAQLALVFLETPTVTLDGGGTVVLVGTDPANIVGSSPATETLVNAATIVGTGFIGGPIHTIDATTTLYPLNLVNEAGGVIDATGSLGASGSTQATFNPGQLLDIENGGSVLVNSGLIEATGIGGMFIEAETIDQSGGGTLRAAGAGVEISLSNAGDSPIAIIGGTLEATDGGVLSISRFANITLDGSQSPLTIGVGSTLSLSMIDAAIDMLGTIQNQGTLSGGSPLILTSPTVTLTGGGTVRDPQIFGHGGSLATLVNGDTIVGSGHIGASNFIYLAPVVDNGVQQFGSAPVALVNLAGGVIDAIGTLNSGSNDIGRGSVAGLLLFNDGATSINDGLIEATGIQGLDIDTGTLDQSGGGTLLASGSGVAVYLQSVDVIGGEILATDGGAIVFNAGANTLAATAGAPIAINAGGVLAVVNSGVANVSAATLTLAGSAVVNAGTLIDGATLILASPTVTFSGGVRSSFPARSIRQDRLS